MRLTDGDYLEILKNPDLLDNLVCVSALFKSPLDPFVLGTCSEADSLEIRVAS